MPEDLLPDDVSYVGEIRKGTFGAILANIDIIESDEISMADKEKVLIVIRGLLESVNGTMHLDKYISWKNQDVQNIMRELPNSK